MKKKILVVDDETRMRILLSDFLTAEGYEVIEASNGREAMNTFCSMPGIRLIILDVMMPELNGWQVCEEIRTISDVPILFLTAMSSENDEIKSFICGADEFIKKPFSPSVLVLRVNALIKRIYGEEDIIEKGMLRIDRTCNMVWETHDLIELSQTEFKLLMYLIQNEHAVLSREQILDNVWGFQYDGTDRTVDTHMNRLRIKLKKSNHYIRTIRGIGYMFEVM
ncbi:MAG: response regulator transcription factor [Clostridia bacterium]|nr:response regulator transcription factor [Clostridia bacterium]